MKKQPANGARVQRKGAKRPLPAEDLSDAEEASDDGDEMDDDELDAENAEKEEEEEEEAKEERKAAPRKVDIFSAIALPKPASRAAAKPSRAPVRPPAAKSSLSHFDSLDDYGDLPAVPLPKRQKPTPLSAPPLLPFPAPSTPTTSTPTPTQTTAFPPTRMPTPAPFTTATPSSARPRSRRAHPTPDGPVPDLSHDVVEGKRRIGRLIEKNEGLKPSRPRDRKTPKTRNRARYEKALVKRRSQVREYQGQGGVYGGEATGIKRNVAKSVRSRGSAVYSARAALTLQKAAMPIHRPPPRSP